MTNLLVTYPAWVNSKLSHQKLFFSNFQTNEKVEIPFELFDSRSGDGGARGGARELQRGHSQDKKVQTGFLLSRSFENSRRTVFGG